MSATDHEPENVGDLEDFAQTFREELERELKRVPVGKDYEALSAFPVERYGYEPDDTGFEFAEVMIERDTHPIGPNPFGLPDDTLVFTDEDYQREEEN
jgi:hypothetical protein